jgi:hypothetical protein
MIKVVVTQTLCQFIPRPAPSHQDSNSLLFPLFCLPLFVWRFSKIT